MIRPQEELEKIAADLREAMVAIISAHARASGLTGAESNAVVVGVVQSLHANLLAALTVTATTPEQIAALKILDERFRKRIDESAAALRRISELESRLEDIEQGSSDRKINESDFYIDDGSKDDEGGKPGPKNFN